MLYDFLDPSWDQVVYNAGQALQYLAVHPMEKQAHVDAEFR